MPTETKPSAGALRMAKAIIRKGWAESHHARALAEIIDAELKPLVEALERLRAERLCTNPGCFINPCPICEAKEALSDFRGCK